MPNLRRFPRWILSLTPFLFASGFSLAVEVQGWDFYSVYRGRHDSSGSGLGFSSSLFQQSVGKGIKEKGVSYLHCSKQERGVCGFWGKLIVVFLKCRKHSD